MKKILFATLIVVSAGAASAQQNVYKGNLLAGGDGSFTTEKEGDYKTSSFDLSPNLGYFFASKFAGGIRTTIGSTKTEFGSSESTTTRFAIAPFVRYYFLPTLQKVNLFADASYGLGNTKQESGTTEYKTDFDFFSVMAGPSIFLTPSAALEITVGYNSIKYDGATDRETQVRVGVGFQVHLPTHR